KPGMRFGLLLSVIILVVVGFTIGAWMRLEAVMDRWFLWGVLIFLVVEFLMLVLWFLPRYRERRFLARLHAEDARIQGNEIKKSYRRVQDKLLRAIRTLESISVSNKKKGLVLYALPWYLLIGASQSGKTTLLRGVAKTFPPSVLPDSGLTDGTTQDCDWW